MLHKIKIKPLSVNKAFQGRRYKTEEYKAFEFEIFHLLPKLEIPEDKPLFLEIEFGFSSKASDIDNPVKSFVDVLQKLYGFDDKMICKMHLKKEIVKKGEEYILFEIKELKK